MLTSLKNFFSRIPLSRNSLSLIGLFVVLTAIPLTVFIAQQEILNPKAEESQCQGTLTYICGVTGSPTNKLTATWNLTPVLGENTCNVFIRGSGQDYKLNSGNECSGLWLGTKFPDNTFVANTGAYQLYVSNGDQNGKCYNVLKSTQSLNCTGTLPGPTSIPTLEIPRVPTQQLPPIPPPISPTTAPVTPTPTLTSTPGLGGTTPPFTQGSVTGPTTGKAGEPLTFTANVSGAVIKGQLWVGPFGLTSSGFPKWEQLGSDEACSHDSICTFSRTWTPTNGGTFYVVVAAFNAVGKNCSGGGVSPSGGPIAPYDCGSSDNITVNISGPALQAAPPTAPPTSAAPTASPTQTLVAGATSLEVAFKLQGVTSPRSSHPVKVEIWNKTETEVFKSGNEIPTTFQNGVFKGTFDLGNFIPGDYVVKLKAGNTLRKRVESITTIAFGRNKLREVELISGDLVQNNELDTADFLALVGCLSYTQGTTSESCPGTMRNSADLNDDGVVDGLDLSILQTNFSHRTGD